MNLRESLKEFFAILNEQQGGEIGLSDPARLQTAIEALNGISKSFAEAKAQPGDKQLLSLQIASDIDNILKA